MRLELICPIQMSAAPTAKSSASRTPKNEHREQRTSDRQPKTDLTFLATALIVLLRPDGFDAQIAAEMLGPKLEVRNSSFVFRFSSGS